MGVLPSFTDAVTPGSASQSPNRPAPAHHAERVRHDQGILGSVVLVAEVSAVPRHSQVSMRNSEAASGCSQEPLGTGDSKTGTRRRSLT